MNVALIAAQVQYNESADAYEAAETAGDFHEISTALEVLVAAEETLIDASLTHVAARHPNHPALAYADLVRQSPRRNTLIDLALGLDVYEPIEQPKPRRRSTRKVVA